MAMASGADKAWRVRENSDKSVRKEMLDVPPDVPYSVLELVGKGSFGSVFKGIHNETKQIVAIKSLDLDQHDDEIKDIQKEISLLSQLKAGEAPNITAFHGSYLLDHRLWVIMDFCSGGSVRTLMKAGPIEEKYIGVIVRESLTALGYLHKNGIIHRDIKAANILVGQDGRVQICDFGVSAKLEGKAGKRNTFVGTPQWMAPEALTGVLYDYKIDIWSFGITIIEMAKQNPPLYNVAPHLLIDRITRRPPPRLEGGNWSNHLREFVALCLNEIPEERATVDDLLRTKFVKTSKGLPTSMMRDLIVKYEAWASRGGVRDSMLQAAIMGEMDQLNATLASEPGWDFDTIKSRLSGVPLSYMTQEGGSNQSTVKANYTPPPISDMAARRVERSGEGLFKLFQSPEDEAQQRSQRGYGPMGSTSDLQFRSGNSTRSATPENVVTTIDIPSFDDSGIRLPDARTPSPMEQIVMPSEEEAMRLAQQKTSQNSLNVTPNSSDRINMQMVPRTTILRSDSLEASVPRPGENQISMPPSPPREAYGREVSPRRPSTAASAPSSPPRHPAYQQNQPLQNSANGLKSHHFPSKSSPNVAGIRDEAGSRAPPLPTINNPPHGKVRSADSTPHAKSRSQDITAGARGLQKPPKTPKPFGNKPSNLNLNLPSNGLNMSNGMLPPSPSRPLYPQHTPQHSLSSAQGIGLAGLPQSAAAPAPAPAPLPQLPPPLPPLEFPAIDPLNTEILSLSCGDPKMIEELDRVLAGLGEALEVMQIGLGSLGAGRGKIGGSGSE